MMMMRCLPDGRGFVDHFAGGCAKNKVRPFVWMGRISDIAPTDERQANPQQKDIGNQADALPTGQLRAGAFALCCLGRILT